MNTVIFLGAGASKADNAPLQKDLFKEYFLSDHYRNSHYDMDSELRTFFYFIFGIDVDDIKEDTMFPTFEEALGILDLAIMRGESLKNFDGINIACNSNRLAEIRNHLIFLMAKIIEISLGKHNSYHELLVKNLYNKGMLSEVSFMSTNYDILIDNAISYLLMNLHYYNPMNCSVDTIDYGIDNIDYKNTEGWSKPTDDAIKLYKIHGSLNWLYCPVCNNVKITPSRKGVIDLISQPQRALCRDCEELLLPIIVPPTYYKDMCNTALNTIWNKSEHLLRNAEHIVFCGYSFPDADMHIKYLLKRIETNRSKPLKVTVINHFDGKDEWVCEEEETRYNRFFRSPVNYVKDCSFQGFAENPDKYI